MFNNTLTDFESYSVPYGYTKEDIRNLPDPSVPEASLWIKGERKKALNLYKSRSKIKDTRLALWMFFVCSTIAHNFLREIELVSKDLAPDNPIPEDR